MHTHAHLIKIYIVIIILSLEDEEEDEEDIVLPLELYNIRRQQRIRDDFSISSSPLPARHNVRTRCYNCFYSSYFDKSNN